MLIIPSSIGLSTDGFGEPSAYTIEQSCRFNDDDSAHMTITPGSAGNLDRFIIGGWFKLCNFGLSRMIMSSGPDDSSSIRFDNADKIDWQDGTGNGRLTTTQVFRDPTAWMQIVASFESADGTAGDRMRLFVNGTEITNFGTDNAPTQNGDSDFFSTQAQYIGRTVGGAQYADYYSAQMFGLNGVSIQNGDHAITDFGADDDYGNWMPKDISKLTPGTNGFLFNFEDSSNLGNDAFGGTDWTESGLAANDKRKDSPTDDADNDIGNYAVMLPITPTDCELRNGNLTNQGDQGDEAFGTNIAWDPTSSDGFYAELHIDSNVMGSNGSSFGIVDVASADYQNGEGSPGTGTNIYWALASGGTMNDASGSEASPTAVSALSISDYYQIAVKSSKVWFGVNDTWANSGDPAAGSNPAFSAVNTCDLVSLFVVAGGGSNRHVVTLRTDPTDFEGTIPSGFNPVCTAHLPAPAILDPRLHFQIQTWAGDGGNDVEVGDTLPVDLTSTGFMQWVKNRTNAADHDIADDLRIGGGGGETHAIIYTNSSLVESVSGEIDAPSSDHMKMNNALRTNHASNNYVGWCWVGGTYGGSSNSNGTITATVNANATAGFSIATYTGTGANATVGHGLSAAPDMILVKCRDAARSWKVYHSAGSSDPQTDYLVLDTNGALVDDATVWNDTAPTSTVFSLGSHNDVNGSGDAFVAYCWAGVEGYSSFGSYIGNQANDGPVVFLGFAPTWVMIKESDAAGGTWHIYDNKRRTYNPNTRDLNADITNAEGYNNADIDLLSNGFKIRTVSTSTNESGKTMIYAAFAENPFGGSGSSQARAR